MTDEPQTCTIACPGVHDWLRIFGAVRMALHPAKLVLALAALVLTFCWGAVLDGVWKLGGQGVESSAIAQFVDTEAVGAVAESTGDHGIGQLWRDHTLMSIRTAMHAVVQVKPWGDDSVCEAAGMLCHATRWMVSQHFFYAVLFLAGMLVIWSVLGAAICRIAAVQFAREEKIGITEAIKFVRERWLSGFFVTPLLPLGIGLFTALLLGIGGVFLWIPGIGNLFAVLLPLALAGGLALAFLLIGCVGGGSFFWPTVAVEGSDGFDAISRSFSYFFSRPVKTVFYGLTALVCSGVCWVVFKFVLWLTLRATHACVSFGVGGFSTHWWGMRESAGQGATKLDVLWSAPVLSDLYRMGDRAQMEGWEIFAAIVIGVSVLLAIGLLWAFLASFYFSGSTVIYYLLRHDVDATDYDDVYIEEAEQTDEVITPPPASEDDAPSAEGEGSPPAAPTPSEPAEPTEPSEPSPPTEKPDESA